MEVGLLAGGGLMTDELRFIAERWIAQHGAATPQLIRQWAKDLSTAPTAAEFLEQIAAAAEMLLGERSSLSSSDGCPSPC